MSGRSGGKIYQWDFSGNLAGIHSSASTAAKSVGIDPHDMRRHVYEQLGIKLAGYIWTASPRFADANHLQERLPRGYRRRYIFYEWSLEKPNTVLGIYAGARGAPYSRRQLHLACRLTLKLKPYKGRLWTRNDDTFPEEAYDAYHNAQAYRRQEHEFALKARKMRAKFGPNRIPEAREAREIRASDLPIPEIAKAYKLNIGIVCMLKRVKYNKEDYK